MTTLDGVERRPRRRDRARLRLRRRPRDRRDHGRPGLRGLRADHPRPARGGELERDQHPPHLAPARPALGGLLALREAAASGPLPARAGGRLEADGRALRRQAGAGHDRRRGRDPRPARADAACRPGQRACSGWRSPRASRPTYLERLGFGVEAAGEDLTVTVPPDRHYDVTREVDLIEEVARVHGIDEHLPTTLPAVRQRRRPQPRAAAAPPRRGRPARPRLRPGGRLELHRPRRAGPPADSRRGPAGQPGRALQPALRGAVGDADHRARLAARRRRPQRGARRRPPRPVRGRRRLPARRSPRRRGRRRWPVPSAASSRRRSPSRTATRRSRSGRWSPAPGAAAASRPTSSR